MNNRFDNILLFSSDIKSEGDKYRVSTVLDNHPLIEQWSVDLDDEERILRVVSDKLNQKNIIDMVGRCGYTCEELKD